ncbi:uncharacterized protein LOC708686 isoform X4 [Macaca mulatta]
MCEFLEVWIRCQELVISYAEVAHYKKCYTRTSPALGILCTTIHRCKSSEQMPPEDLCAWKISVNRLLLHLRCLGFMVREHYEEKNRS